MKKQIVKWTFDRPYSVCTACLLGLFGALLGSIWMPLMLVGALVWLGLIIFAGFCIPHDRYSAAEKAKRAIKH